VKDSDIIAAIAPDAVSLMDKAIAEIKRLRQENATLTAERDEARSAWGQATWDRSKSEESHRAWISDMKKLRDQAIEDYRRLSTRLAEYQREWTRQEERFIYERDQAVRERNDARTRVGRILNEIDCRVQHGADSNGHLEASLSLFKEDGK
jgi:hypothetical protein